MKNLVLHSNQVTGRKDVDLAFLDLVGKPNPRIGYIPSCSDFERRHYREKVEWYNQFGISSLLYFDLDHEYKKDMIDDLLSCDAIHLSGGDTFYFLHLLRKRNFAPILREYAAESGILIGVSAGSMLISQSIGTANLFAKNNIDMRNFSALGLVEFEFFPHLGRYESIPKELLEYSVREGSTIYACNDGDGIVINDDEMQFIGSAVKIEGGMISIMNQVKK